MRFWNGLLLIAILLIPGLPARASTWFPIDAGRFWVYSSQGQGPASVTIEEQEEFGGSLTHPFRWNHGDREYLYENGAGQVYLHGVRFSNGYYVVFDPPVLRMEPDLTLNQEWSTTTVVTQYTDTGAKLTGSIERFTYRVIAMGPIEVGAGEFDAAEVLVSVERGNSPAGARAAVAELPLTLAAPASRRATSVIDSYAAGVGWIRRTDENRISVIFELQDYGSTGVPVATTSWGELKARFER